ncbi:hypothetical protein C6496_21990 [Candidatus Poribacteria bacterium]|nr:MAG: hypothetical protein C6496_21990 [Candidatus Poribacteria bacterium]
MFKRKWHGALTVFVALCVGVGVLFLRPKMENPETIRIYKVVTPDLKPRPTKSGIEETDVVPSHSHGHNDDSSHKHFHGAESHSHAAETPISNGESDWRDDGVFDSSSSEVNPWEQTYLEQEFIDTDDTYPPRDWHKTENPELRAEYLHAQLLKQFGDIPEVHIIGEYHLEHIARGKKRTYNIHLTYLEALNTLFPNAGTANTITEMKQAKANGVKFVYE